MTEDDTYTALKKWPYKDALEYFIKIVSDSNHRVMKQKLKEVTGWKWEEFYVEWMRIAND